MRLKTNFALMALMAGCGLLLAVGQNPRVLLCSKSTMKVIVPENFHGTVSLNCTSFREANNTATVGLDGRLDGVA
jgi:hypothetical protein